MQKSISHQSSSRKCNKINQNFLEFFSRNSECNYSYQRYTADHKYTNKCVYYSNIHCIKKNNKIIKQIIDKLIHLNIKRCPKKLQQYLSHYSKNQYPYNNQTFFLTFLEILHRKRSHLKSPRLKPYPLYQGEGKKGRKIKNTHLTKGDAEGRGIYLI